MPVSTLTPVEREAKDAARTSVRNILQSSGAFAAMSVSEQQSLYQSLVQDEFAKELVRRGVEPSNGLAGSMATDSGGDMGYKGYDPSFGNETKDFKDLVDSVDFPKFVADLLKSVFDANISVMKQQTDSYIKLMKECTKSAADFIKQVKDDESFARLAESKSAKYNVTTEKQADGSQKLALTNPNGDKVDPEDSEVKKDILEEKLNMAKEHRAALRELLLGGIQRMYVKKGEIEAGVDFSIHATRDSKAHHDDQNINTNTWTNEYGSGVLGDVFGGPSGSVENTNTNIQVNTSDKHATDDMTATLHGKVNIEFATDLFNLNNFATMYADGGTAALKPAGAAGGTPGLPVAAGH